MKQTNTPDYDNVGMERNWSFFKRCYLYSIISILNVNDRQYWYIMTPMNVILCSIVWVNILIYVSLLILFHSLTRGIHLLKKDKKQQQCNCVQWLMHCAHLRSISYIFIFLLHIAQDNILLCTLLHSSDRFLIEQLNKIFKSHLGKDVTLCWKAVGT